MNQINAFNLQNREAQDQLVWKIVYTSKHVYLEVTLSYKDYIAKTKAKFGSRNNILKKLVNIKLSAHASTIHITLALYYYTAEYASPA